MAKYHRKYHRRRSNPLGVNGGVVKDAVFVAAGALGSAALPGMVAPSMASGWSGVIATGAAAIGLSMLGKMAGGAAAAEEVLKGGLAVTVIKALHQAGFAQSLGLGLYAQSYFAVPTASDQYMRSAAPGMQFNRGGGTIFFPGPGSSAIAALPAPGSKAAALHGMRFRSRYAGRYR